MTLGEYAKQVSNNLRNVSSYKDALPIIAQADYTLNESNLSTADQKIFWIAVQNNYSMVEVIKRQDSTAVNSVITAIQNSIQNKAKSL